MKSKKTFICLIIALAALFIPLAGCGAKPAEQTLEPASGAESPAGTDTASNSDAAAESESAGASEFSYSEGIDENGFLQGVRALDYVELFNYQAMPIPSDAHQVTDDALQSEIDSMLASYSSSAQVTDRAVADGDTVNIDYVGSVDGVEFNGGSTGGAGTEVTIGVTSYIDNFLEQLIGHTPGETFDVNVTFPDVYQEESLQGKAAVFVTTVNYIVEKTEATLSDDFVATNLSASTGWTTVETMKAGMRAELQKNAVQQYIQQYFTSEATVRSVPDQLVTYQESAMMQYYQEYAGYYGMELTEFLNTYEGVESVDEIKERNRENNVQNAKFYLVAQAVAEDAGISVNEEDVSSYFTEYVGTSDYSVYTDQYGLPYLKQVVLCQKVLDYIAGHAVLS